MDSRRQGPPGNGGAPDAPDHAALLHETTNALTVILGWIERATEASAGRPEVAAALERAAAHAIGMRHALRRAIGAQVAEEPPVRVDAMAERTMEDLAIESRKAGVAARTAVAPGCGQRMIAHANAAWQILTNLLLNAIAVSPSGSTVELRAVADEDDPARVRFSVTDQGPGVDAVVREQIFRRNVSHRAGGAGIGLVHAHALARRLGGELSLADTDEGARFDLCWPVRASASEPVAAAPAGGPPARPDEPALAPAADTAPASTPSPSSSRALHGRSILLLEDDNAVVELLELTLTARGARLTTVRTADELPAALRAGRFDTLLLDLSPLGDDAESVIAQAQATHPRLVVIVISGSASPQTLADAWVRKPFEPSELVTAIARAHASTAAP